MADRGPLGLGDPGGDELGDGAFRAKDAEKFCINVRTGNGQLTAVGYDVSRGGIYVDRTKEEIKNAPAYDPSGYADQEYRLALADYYGRFYE